MLKETWMKQSSELGAKSKPEVAPHSAAECESQESRRANGVVALGLAVDLKIQVQSPA